MIHSEINFFEKIGNILGLTIIIGVLLTVLAIQVFLYQLPCPLCLLQRIGFFFMAFGFLLNMRFGFRSSHYAIVILSSVFTAFVALRQIALHIAPGTGTYGTPLFGLHLYTWSFIVSMGMVCLSCLLLGITEPEQEKPFDRSIKYTHLFFTTTTLLIVFNIIGVVLECGFKICPDNPTRYEFLEGE